MKPENLIEKTPYERAAYVHDRYKLVFKEYSQAKHGKWITATQHSPNEVSIIKFPLGSARCILGDENLTHLVFCGKLSVETGMPEYGELWDKTKESYYVGPFWWGQKPQRNERTPTSPAPSRRKIAGMGAHLEAIQSPPRSPCRTSQYALPGSQNEEDVLELHLPRISQSGTPSTPPRTSTQAHATPPKSVRSSTPHTPPQDLNSSTLSYDEYCSCECCKLTYEDQNTTQRKILKRHGEGQLVFSDGRLFTGTFHNDQFHGWGSFFWHNGCIFSGQYRFGYKHGRGKMTYPNGNYHLGQYFKSKRHGYGISHSPNRGVWYCGYYENDERHGHGILQYDNPEKDLFRWKQGLFQFNRPQGEFFGIRHDFIPVKEVFDRRGKQVQQEVLVIEGLKQHLAKLLDDGENDAHQREDAIDHQHVLDFSDIIVTTAGAEVQETNLKAPSGCISPIECSQASKSPYPESPETSLSMKFSSLSMDSPNSGSSPKIVPRVLC